MNRTYSHQSPSVLDVRDPYSQFYQGPHHGKHWYLWHPDDIGTAKPMNEVEWFKAFQPLLLRVINTGYGRQLMGINPNLPPIELITKNAIRYYIGEGNWQSQIHIGAKWANVIRYRWPEFKRYARFFYDMPHFFTLLNINGRMVPAHATHTSYPDPHVESTTVDGHCRKSDGADFAATRSSATSNQTSDDEESMYPYSLWQYFKIRRQWSLFDTSSINDAHAVSAAVLSISGTGGAGDNDGGTSEDHYICLVGGAPASNTAIVAGDYDGMTALNSPTEFVTRSIDVNNYTTADAAYNNVFTLNAAGRSYISLDGVTKFMFRGSFDIDDSAASTSNNEIYARAADYTGTDKDPKLVVTHAVASDVEKINGIALADIEKFNGITPANAEEINGLTF